MHVQSCCFAYKTYCFFDVLVAVRVVRSQSPPLIGTLRSDDATAMRTSKIRIDLVDKTTALHVHLTFLYISLLFLHGYDMKLPD